MFTNKIFIKIFRFVVLYEQNYKYSLYTSRYQLPKSFKFNGNGIKFYGDGLLRIGKKTYIGSYSRIQLTTNTEVIIGDFCRISHNVRIYTSSAIADQDFRKAQSLQYKIGNVNIGDGVWIGANVLINPGITISSNSVIGANSVVTKDIPPNSIYGGVPAKLIRTKNV